MPFSLRETSQEEKQFLLTPIEIVFFKGSLPLYYLMWPSNTSRYKVPKVRARFLTWVSYWAASRHSPVEWARQTLLSTEEICYRNTHTAFPIDLWGYLRKLNICCLVWFGDDWCLVGFGLFCFVWEILSQNVDQADLEPTEAHLPLPPWCYN